MCPQVDRQGGSVTKALLALRTLVVFRRHVDTLVFRPITRRYETLPTLVTTVGFLSRMNALMKYDTIGLLEGFATI